MNLSHWACNSIIILLVMLFVPRPTGFYPLSLSTPSQPNRIDLDRGYAIPLKQACPSLNSYSSLNRHDAEACLSKIQNWKNEVAEINLLSPSSRPISFELFRWPSFKDHEKESNYLLLGFEIPSFTVEEQRIGSVPNQLYIGQSNSGMACFEGKCETTFSQNRGFIDLNFPTQKDNQRDTGVVWIILSKWSDKEVIEDQYWENQHDQNEMKGDPFYNHDYEGLASQSKEFDFPFSENGFFISTGDATFFKVMFQWIKIISWFDSKPPLYFTLRFFFSLIGIAFLILIGLSISSRLDIRRLETVGGDS